MATHPDEEVSEVFRFGRANRRYIELLTICLALIVLLLVAVIGLAWKTWSLSQEADHNSSSARVTCISGNESRSLQVELWNFVLDLPPTSPRSVEQTRQIDQLRVHIAQTYAQRDCSNA